MFKWLINIAIVLALSTILLGAYTRLTDAGLGCPDWPGCYGFLAVPKQAAQLAEAQARFPQAKVETHKAHNEMFHRYVAGLLGLSVLAIFATSLWCKERRVFTGFLLLLVIMQAALGMWTVTLNLLPVVVLAHLLGGFALFSLLVLLRVRLNNTPIPGTEFPLKNLRFLAWLALVVLLVQISLGVWTSSNYAALACHQLPLCESGWQERFNAAAAFHLPWGHSTYEYGVLTYDARLTIHVLHRMGALITLIVVGTFTFLVWRKSSTKKLQRLALGVASLLILQVCLGVINVVAFLPLLNALAHNVIAANLLMLLVVFINEFYRVQLIKS